MELDAKIESILFYKGEPVSIRELAKVLDVSRLDINKSLKILEEKLENRGIKLVVSDDDVLLGTSKEMSSIIEKIRKEELSKNLGKASLETLTIILYKGPISKPDIDYIRGVNSATILRSLLIRGLIKREESPQNKRTYLYNHTIDLMAYLGLENIKKLPEYESIKNTIGEFEKTFKISEEENVEKDTNFENVE